MNLIITGEKVKRWGWGKKINLELTKQCVEIRLKIHIDRETRCARILLLMTN